MTEFSVFENNEIARKARLAEIERLTAQGMEYGEILRLVYFPDWTKEKQDAYQKESPEEYIRLFGEEKE